MGLRYNVEMSGAHLRYFFFTLTAAAALLLAARSHGQQTIEPRTFLYPYSLPAVDQGLMRDLTPGPATAARIKSLSLVSAAAAVSERPSYANFDIVRIDPADDAEAVAAALSQHPDVEYA